ncbi:endo alpha-1,4 polygalactosaminidase [Saccharopolyspora sp. 6V]|uniref:endo alpha-1,4 polygalactosaminidase n=1 Tax=Saccharopolyspora sp. 6V TaxID=2877239 RepID=UPI001CD6C14F|nr:endo alpha-1,4 polygalactosaminidase [Saccharopolyspora sp. 6V]MCA1191938.1 endo alpha-1,4 polygalactosaminidase [Saccharopolyspora sp. 6V]
MSCVPVAKRCAVLGAAVLALTACGTGPERAAVREVAAETPTGPARTAPPVGGVHDYQLGGAYPPPAGVTVVTRDSTAEPAPGLHNICYVNGFQTQPADRELWLEQRRDLVLSGPDGEPVVDPGWPDELLLDTSTEQHRIRLAEIIGGTVADCATRGFDSVELDNLDSYTRSDGALDADDNLAFAGLLVDAAHRAGLAVAQKNAAELSARGKDEVGYDFAITESCHRWEECADYAEHYGGAVLDVEYADDLRGTFPDVCADPATPATTTLRDHDLVPPTDPAHVFDHC